MALWDDATEVYDFDVGALVTAQKDAAHNLTDNNACGVDAVDFKQGDQSVDLNGSNEFLSLADDPHFDVGAGNDYSLAVWEKGDSGGGITVVDKCASGNGYRIYDTWDNKLTIDHDNEWAGQACETGLVLGTGWNHVIVTFDASAGNEIVVYVSRSAFGDVSDAGAFNLDIDAGASSAVLQIGNGFPGYHNGHLDEYGWFNGKILNAAEAESIFDGTWRGGAAYSLVCEGGSIAIGKETASLLRDGKIVPGAGSMTLTGQTITPLRDAKIVPYHGTFGIYGQKTTELLRAAKIVPEAGSMVLTGQAAAIGRQFTLDAGAGAFGLTGQTVTPLRDSKVVPDPGGYAISGQTAALLRTGEIVPEAGSYTLTGQDVAALRAGKVGVEAGLFALTGTAATLLRAGKLVPAAGAFVLTGQDVALGKGRRLSVEAGAIVLTGEDASLLSDRTIIPGAGAYALTGFDTELTYAPSLGTYPITYRRRRK